MISRPIGDFAVEVSAVVAFFFLAWALGRVADRLRGGPPGPEQPEDREAW